MDVMRAKLFCIMSGITPATMPRSRCYHQTRSLASGYKQNILLGQDVCHRGRETFGRISAGRFAETHAERRSFLNRIDFLRINPAHLLLPTKSQQIVKLPLPFWEYSCDGTRGRTFRCGKDNLSGEHYNAQETTVGNEKQSI
jgi:hypothetical protein